MITIVYKPTEFKLTFKGHAGGVKGKDIVCSAVSILFYTLAESLERNSFMLTEYPLVKDDEEEDEKIIVCTPQKKFTAPVKTTYQTVMNGLYLLASQYPKR